MFEQFMVIRKKDEKVTLNAKKVAIGVFLPQITAKAVLAASLSGSPWRRHRRSDISATMP